MLRGHPKTPIGQHTTSSIWTMLALMLGCDVFALYFAANVPWLASGVATAVSEGSFVLAALLAVPIAAISAFVIAFSVMVGVMVRELIRRRRESE